MNNGMSKPRNVIMKSDDYYAMLDANKEMLEICEMLVKSRETIGWEEGDCDLFLGVVWHRAREAVTKYDY